MTNDESNPNLEGRKLETGRGPPPLYPVLAPRPWPLAPPTPLHPRAPSHAFGVAHPPESHPPVRQATRPKLLHCVARMETNEYVKSLPKMSLHRNVPARARAAVARHPLPRPRFLLSPESLPTPSGSRPNPPATKVENAVRRDVRPHWHFADAAPTALPRRTRPRRCH